METEKATLHDLVEALRETLQFKGVIDDLKAHARAEIHSCLDMEDVPKPKLNNENLIVNELILEYLDFNGYNHASSVLRAESGQPKQGTLDESFTRRELGLSDGGSGGEGGGLPALYGIVEVRELHWHCFVASLRIRFGLFRASDNV